MDYTRRFVQSQNFTGQKAMYKVIAHNHTYCKLLVTASLRDQCFHVTNTMP